MAVNIKGLGGKGVGVGEDVERALLSRKTAAKTAGAAVPTLSPGVIGTAAIGAGAVAVGAGAAALSKPAGAAQFGDDPVSAEEMMASQVQAPGVLGTVSKIAAAPSNMF